MRLASALLGLFAAAADWAPQTNYSGTLAKMDFAQRLETVYCPSLSPRRLLAFHSPEKWTTIRRP